MSKIEICASEKYEVVIGSGKRKELSSYLSKLGNIAKVMIVSDDAVFEKYGKELTDDLSGFEVFSYVFASGEDSKNASTLFSIISSLSENAFSRSDVVVALGGGVTTDISGLASSLYLRGIRYVSLPTTLLAMTDAAIGGKTAIDTEFGKNLVGTFYHPSLVICDTDYLSTLSEDILLDGLCEVLKYGFIRDESIVSRICAEEYDIEKLVYDCVNIKREFIEKDERDVGERMMLNFGHTVGHAVEKLSDYTISHGRAVFLGMCVMTKFYESKGICENGAYDVLCAFAKRNGLSTLLPFRAKDIADAATRDKKHKDGVLSLVIPEKVGKCRIVKSSDGELYEIIKEYDSYFANHKNLFGNACAPSSKSHAIRTLLLSAFCRGSTDIACDVDAEDIWTAVGCVRSLGAKVTKNRSGLTVEPCTKIPEKAILDCKNCGAALRFLLPIVAFCGIDAEIRVDPELAARPHTELIKKLCGLGAEIEFFDGVFHVYKKASGNLSFKEGISSQYISGAILAAAIVDRDCKVSFPKNQGSYDYISLTKDIAGLFGAHISLSKTEAVIKASGGLESPKKVVIPKDKSGSAYLMCAAALAESSDVSVDTDISDTSGDGAFIEILHLFGADVREKDGKVNIKSCDLHASEVFADGFPDLVPAICALALKANGETVIRRVSRLKYKESDRLSEIGRILSSLGADFSISDDEIRIRGGETLRGTEFYSNDHRMIMLAAAIAPLCDGGIKIYGTSNVAKSFASFFEILTELVG